jgi:hypothetical protein
VGVDELATGLRGLRAGPPGSGRRRSRRSDERLPVGTSRWPAEGKHGANGPPYRDRALRDARRLGCWHGAAVESRADHSAADAAAIACGQDARTTSTMLGCRNERSDGPGGMRTTHRCGPGTASPRTRAAVDTGSRTPMGQIGAEEGRPGVCGPGRQWTASQRSRRSRVRLRFTYWGLAGNGMSTWPSAIGRRHGAAASERLASSRIAANSSPSSLSRSPAIEGVPRPAARRVTHVASPGPSPAPAVGVVAWGTRRRGCQALGPMPRLRSAAATRYTVSPASLSEPPRRTHTDAR